MKILTNYTLAATLAAGAAALSHHHRHHHVRRDVVPSRTPPESIEVNSIEVNSIEVNSIEVNPLEVKPLDSSSVEVSYVYEFLEGDKKTPMDPEEGRRCLREKRCTVVPDPTSDVNVPVEVSFEMSVDNPAGNSMPVEKKPVEKKPVEKKPVEKKPVEKKPIEKKPVEKKPVEEKPVEKKPVEEKPVETKPVEKSAEQPSSSFSSPGTSSENPPPPPPQGNTVDPTQADSTSGHGDRDSNLDGGVFKVSHEILSMKFPSNSIKCSQFPEKYGVVRIHNESANEAPWSSLQRVDGYPGGSKLTVDGSCDSCKPGCMCSYACPPGYGECQWPQAQGSKNESVGGLHCNSKGFLELTSIKYKTLCRESAGNVTIQNDMKSVISACRTVYPGNEAMVVPAMAKAGQRVPLWIPNNGDYLSAVEGQPTSAQYYVNPKGIDSRQGCVWEGKGDLENRVGDKAPLILGGSEDQITKMIFLGMNENPKGNITHAEYSVRITGSDLASKECVFTKGKFVPNTNPLGAPPGCTVTIKPGSSVTIIFQDE